MMSPLGLVNSAWLLEHQVKDNQVLKLQPGPRGADFATVTAQDLQGAQLGPLKTG